MKKYLLLSMFMQFICVTNTFAQKYDYQWLHGAAFPGFNNNFIINFNSIPPAIDLYSSSYLADATSISCSDENGNYQFFSNGCQIFDKSDQLMSNGDSLIPDNPICNASGSGDGLRLPHGVFSLPLGADNKFIIFSFQNLSQPVSNDCGVTRFLYHIVDMKGNQGKGLVIKKNQPLLEGCFQIACANKHANGRDWWILLADNQQNYFYRWLLTPSGLEGPWTQEIYNPTIDGLWFCGWSEFSPDGERYIINNCRTGVACYNFDRCSGLLYNQLLLSRSINAGNWSNYGATFSQDSRFVYTVNNGGKELLQYDLNAANIDSSREIISIWDGYVYGTFNKTAFAFMQLGPDGKLYMWAGSSPFMHIANYPNRKGANCNVIQRAITLPTSVSAANLYYPRYRLGPIDGSSCDTLGIDNRPQALFRYDLEDTLSPLQVTFTDLTSYAPTAWHWDFGDGATSSETDPVHAYAAAGDYQVCLIASNVNAADTFCRQVKVGVLGIEQLPVLPQLSVSPNPFGSVLRIDLPALISEKPHFVLYDLFGREVTSAYLHDFQTELPLGRLPAGMYLWRAYVRGTAVQSGKVVKE